MATDSFAEPPPFAGLVQSRRRELGLTRKDLVEASGLSYPYVAQLETGQRTPSRRSVARLAEALQLSPDELAAAIPYDEEAPRARTTTTARGTWQTNPVYRSSPDGVVAGPPPPRGRRSRREAVLEVIEVVSDLPPAERLDALLEAHKQVVAAMLDERSS